MRKYTLILCILFLSCCVNKHGSDTQATSSDNTSIAENDKTKPLLIGGEQYRGYIIGHSEEKYCTLDDIDDIEELVLYLRKPPYPPLGYPTISNLNGIEQLYNAQNLKSIRINGKYIDSVDLSPLEQLSNTIELSISIRGGSIGVLPDLTALGSLRTLIIYDVTFKKPYTLDVPPGLTNLTLEGTNLDNVDLSVIETLHELRSLWLAGDFPKLPDLSKLENLRSINIGSRYTDATLESLERIGAPNVKHIEITSSKRIDSIAPLKNLVYLESLKISNPGKGVYKIADIANLPNLKHLSINIGGKVDLQGIENMSVLEGLWLNDCEPFNIEGIGKLNNLEELSLNLISPAPSLEFLRDMPNLSYLHLYANARSDARYAYFPHETEAYQILDVSPLATVKSLQELSCINFIIKNVSALDKLDTLKGSIINFIWSRLYDETEKSEHTIWFENLSG